MSQSVLSNHKKISELKAGETGRISTGAVFQDQHGDLFVAAAATAQLGSGWSQVWCTRTDDGMALEATSSRETIVGCSYRRVQNQNGSARIGDRRVIPVVELTMKD